MSQKSIDKKKVIDKKSEMRPNLIGKDRMKGVIERKKQNEKYSTYFILFQHIF